jgi:hypothetical protein
MKTMEPKPRSGAILIGVLACLGTVVVLVGISLQTSLRSRAEATMQRQILQTDLLCQAGVLRAVNQLQRDPVYRGERWEPNLDIARFAFASVDIAIDSTDPHQSKIKIVATLGQTKDNSHRVQRTYETP